MKSAEQIKNSSGAIDSETISINAEARVPNQGDDKASYETNLAGGRKGRKIRRKKLNPALNTVIVKDDENLRVDPVAEQNHPHYYNQYVFSV